MANNSSASDDAAATGIAAWFPTVRDDWRLDVVTLLAVIGESSMAEHSQAITSSFLCLLPRIIPAPQALLKPARSPRMPEVTAKMAGVYSGVVLDTVGFFANIIHPLDALPAFAFKVLEIRHTDRNDASAVAPGGGSGGGPKGWLRRTRAAQDLSHGTEKHRKPGPPRQLPVSLPPGNGTPRVPKEETALSDGATLVTSESTALEGDPERNAPGTVRRRRTMRDTVTDYLANPTMDNKTTRPAVPPKLWSPVHIISVVSCLLTFALIGAAIHWQDGTAILAVAVVSMASSIVGYASWWKPLLMSRTHKNKVPDGDVVIRTREGAFVLIRCTEEVARELYSGTEECQYHVGNRVHRGLMGLGTVLLMVSVVLLGNCKFQMQVFIGASYIMLNGLYWSMSMLPKHFFWDLSRYTWEDLTPADAQHAEKSKDDGDPREDTKSFTRTLWYVIRETKQTSWAVRSGAAHGTAEWRRWLEEAQQAAREGKRDWPAVARKDEIMNPERHGDQNAAQTPVDMAAQHVPAQEIQRMPSLLVPQGSF